MRELGIYAEISARAKDVPSLVKKLIVKKHLTYETLPDKAGVRVIVRYRSEVPVAQAAIQAAFSFAAADNKAEQLESNKVGYQSIHIDRLSFKPEDAYHDDYPGDVFFAELQLRTQSQHLWSEFTHDTVYKNDATLLKMPDDLLRRVNLMAGLIEVADREFDRMSLEMPNDQAVTLLRELEGLYYRLSARRPNVDLSLEVIRLLLPLYGREDEHQIMRQHITKTFDQSRSMLQQVYSTLEDDEDVSAFLFQPEALMIYDRLIADRDRTLSTWNQNFPPEELERVAAAFGMALD
jgi:ppGpp synthetase/RelA/SpoT-type nucleotidyltranferase